MKCENCGKNEVNFIYRSNVNGHVEEHHMCSECAEKLGYSQKIAAQGRSLMQSFGNFFGGDFFGDSFFSMPRLMGGLLEDPFDDFFSEMPALGAPRPNAAPEKPQELVDEQEQSRFAKTRELNALRMEMQKAVREENFERAAELRDKIHAMESQGE